MARMWSFRQLLICAWLLLPPSAAFLDFSACVFPFIYNNKTYSTCTKDGSEVGWLWCATTNSYDRDHKWKRCYEKEHGGNSDGKPCVFPFVYKGRKFYTCTDESTKPRMFWCATTSHYDEDRKWSYCADTILVRKPCYAADQKKSGCDPSGKDSPRGIEKILTASLLSADQKEPSAKAKKHPEKKVIINEQGH